MEQGSDLQKPHSYFEFLKRVLTHRSIIIWAIISALALLLAIFADIRILSIFSELPPTVGLCFLLVILVIFVVPENRDMEIGITGLTIQKLTIILLVALLGLAISFQSESFYISNLIQLGFMFLIPLLIVLFTTGVDRKLIGFFIGNRENLIWTLIIGFLYGLLVWILIGASNLFEAIDQYLPSQWVQYIPSALFTAIVMILFAVAIPEEFLFRAVVQPAMTERFGRVNGILLSSVIFGLFHIPANFMMYLIISPLWIDALIGSVLMAFLFQAQIGLVFGVAYEWTKSLLMPVMLHAIHDIIEMFPYFVYLVWPQMIVIVL
jgi:membrane protease YdiL (CAAX protease family)